MPASRSVKRSAAPPSAGGTLTALYIRCSNRDQVAHGFSIPDQLARLRAEAQRAGETVVAEFIDQARTIAGVLGDPALAPAHWQDPEARLALRRALRLLTHALILRDAGPGAFHVEVQLYDIRENILHEGV